MCEICDKLEAATGMKIPDDVREKITSQAAEHERLNNEIIPKVLGVLGGLMKDLPQDGLPSYIRALAIATGITMSKAPQPIRAMVLAATIKEIVAAMNDGLPEDEKMGMNFGPSDSPGDATRSGEGFPPVKPPLH